MTRFTDFLQLAEAFKSAKIAPQSAPAPEPDEVEQDIPSTWANRNAWRHEPLPTPDRPLSPNPHAAPLPTPPAPPPAPKPEKQHCPKLLDEEVFRQAVRDETDDLRQTLAEQTRQLSALKATLKEVKALLSNLAQTTRELANPPPPRTPQPPPDTLLQTPETFTEAFPGELRELLLDTLHNALANATSCGRARRQAALEAILQSNPSTGDLSRRQTLLKQLLKDAGRFIDAKALEPLGFTLDGGGKHWKLRYANFTHTLPKTPSDHRSNLNAAAYLINRFL